MIDTTNKFLVASGGDEILVMAPAPRGKYAFDDALLLAAWIVAIADGQGSHSFAEVLEAVQGT